LEPLLAKIMTAPSIAMKLEVVNGCSAVEQYLNRAEALRSFLRDQTESVEYAVKAVIAIGQGPLVFQGFTQKEDKINALQSLVKLLLEVEAFYKSMGGIVGYHVTLLKLISAKDKKKEAQDSMKSYLRPMGLDLAQASKEVARAIRSGIEGLPTM